MALIVRIKNRIRSIEKSPIASRQRIWECDDTSYPERTPSDWVMLARGEGLELARERHNVIADQGMEAWAQIAHGSIVVPPAYITGRWHKQGVGSCNAGTNRNQKQLGVELFRKGFTDFVRNGRELTTSTFFSGADYANAQTTVASGGTVNGCNLTSALNFQTNDYVRIGLATGYEYRTITLTGVAVVFDTPLSAAPPNGTTIDQMTDEAMFFGDTAAIYADGTASFTNGSAAVTGVGTEWLANVGPGDMIKVDGARKFYEILTVNGDGSITLTANFAEDTTGAVSYMFKGTAMNRVNGFRYLKTTRGFVFENQIALGG